MPDYTIDRNSSKLSVGPEVTTGQRIYTTDPDVVGVVALPDPGDAFNSTNSECLAYQFDRWQPEKGKQARLSYRVSYSTDVTRGLLKDRITSWADIPIETEPSGEIVNGAIIRTIDMRLVLPYSSLDRVLREDDTYADNVNSAAFMGRPAGYVRVLSCTPERYIRPHPTAQNLVRYKGVWHFSIRSIKRAPVKVMRITNATNRSGAIKVTGGSVVGSTAEGTSESTPIAAVTVADLATTINGWTDWTAAVLGGFGATRGERLVETNRPVKWKDATDIVANAGSFGWQAEVNQEDGNYVNSERYPASDLNQIFTQTP